MESLRTPGSLPGVRRETAPVKVVPAVLITVAIISIATSLLIALVVGSGEPTTREHSGAPAIASFEPSKRAMPAECPGTHRDSLGDSYQTPVVPVLLVHGAGSSQRVWTRKRIDGATNLLDSLKETWPGPIYRFNYESDATQWVTDPQIGPLLADALECITGAAGGPSVAVTHSLGSLAIRDALARIDEPSTSVVSTVITIASLEEGSELLAKYHAGNPTLNGLLAQLGSGCDANSRQSKTDMCGLLKLPDSGAGRGLAAGSAELAALAPWPDGIRIYAIAGDAEIDDPVLMLFGAGDLLTGDAVVSVASATAASTEEPFVVHCKINLSGLPSAPCLHHNLSANGEIIDAVIAILVPRI